MGVMEWAIIALVLLVAGFGFSNGMFSGIGIGASSDDDGGNTINIVDTTGTVTAKLGYAADALSKTTKLTTETHELFLASDKDSELSNTESVTDGTSKTYALGNVLQVLVGSASTDYYALMTPELVLDKEAFTLSTEVDMLLYKNYSSTTDLTVKVINEDDDDANAAGNEQTLSADEVVALEVSFTGKSNAALSPYGQNLIVCDINKTTIEDLSFGSPFVKTNMIPTQHSVGTVDDRAVAFLFPSIIDYDKNVVRDAIMEIDTDDSSAPGNTEDIECTIYDYDWYENSNSGEWEQGYETNTGSDVGGPNQAFTVYYS